MQGFPTGRSTNNLWAFLHEQFETRGISGVLGARGDNSWWVDPINGNDARDGRTIDTALLTLTKCLTFAVAGDFIFCLPGRMDETPTLSAVTHAKVTIIGVGGRGACFIDPSTEDANGLTVHADDVTLINIGAAGEDETSAIALTVTGDRFRAYGCKFEGGLKQLVIGPGTVAQIAALTRGKGADSMFEDCEFCWGTNGVVLTASDYGAVTQAKFRHCLFHNLTAAAFEETGGTVSIRYRDIWISDCIFSDNEDGSAPTKFLSLNDDNTNAGQVSGCWFPTTLAGGLNLVSTAMHWISNYHTGGVSTGQPS